MIVAIAAAAFCLFAIAVHFASIGIVAVRCRRPDPVLPADLPAISLVRPVCGIDNFDEETLRSSFSLDYPDYEIVFCAARADDPVVGLVRALMLQHPGRPSRLLIGDDRISANPKLNNVFKGWNAARHEWIMMADSNVLMPPDYIQRLMSRWRDGDTGLVCSPPVGSKPANFWAEVECAFLNTFQTRWQFVADSIGIGFAQGKSMLFRKDIVEKGGGIRRLGAELAEDAATTKLIHEAGLNVRLVGNAFEQPLGIRSARQIWARQARWAKLRRLTFPLFYAPEILSGAALPTLAAIFVAARFEIDVPATVIGLWAMWYGAEMLLARLCGWHVSARLPFACIARDFLLPALWLYAWFSDDFIWRGNAMSVAEPAAE